MNLTASDTTGSNGDTYFPPTVARPLPEADCDTYRYLATTYSILTCLLSWLAEPDGHLVLVLAPLPGGGASSSPPDDDAEAARTRHRCPVDGVAAGGSGRQYDKCPSHRLRALGCGLRRQVLRAHQEKIRRARLVGAKKDILYSSPVRRLGSQLPVWNSLRGEVYYLVRDEIVAD